MKSTYDRLHIIKFFLIPHKILQSAKSTEILNTRSRGWDGGSREVWGRGGLRGGLGPDPPGKFKLIKFTQ